MSKLKLGAIPDNKSVKLTVELPAEVNRDLIAYAEVLTRETGQTIEPAKLIAPMLARFIVSDRGFAKARRGLLQQRTQTQPVLVPKLERTE